MSTLIEEDNITFRINEDYTSEVTTGQLDEYLPGIQAQYGDVSVQVQIDFQKLGDFSINEADS